MAELRIEVVDREAVDRLKPLWRVLHDHHVNVAPPGLRDFARMRGPDATWRIRRERYRDWLAGAGSFALVATRAGRAVGYAVVSVDVAGPGSWDVGERLAELQTLVVRPEQRGQGVGRALLDETHRRLATEGVRTLVIAVLAGNHEAVRFYEREGAVPFLTTLLAAVRPLADGVGDGE